MEANEVLGKIPVQIVEIDQDLCSLTYGVGACTAPPVSGAGKCYNTRATCLALDSFTLGDPLTLRFVKPHSDALCTCYAIPSLSSVSTSATKLNIGGRSGELKALGKRTRVTIGLVDHPHSDNFTDPYVSERGFDPLTRGTFWAKWLKRNPYYNGRSLRVRDGYLGQDLSEMQTRHYIIESISLPDSRGNVRITALDVLRLADDDKAQCPPLSTGTLLSDITETDTALVVTGGVIADYSLGGVNIIRIGDELITYSGITVLGGGDLQFNSLTRGAFNTEIEGYEAGDLVQACVRYDNIRPDLIAYDLLTTYGNIPSSWIDLAGWEQEALDWFGSISGSRIISEPTGVTTLLGELSEQYAFFIWWDETAQLIRLKAIAPVFGQVPLFTEDFNLLQNQTSLKSEDDKRVSEVWVSYIQRDYTTDGTSRADYARTLAQIDPTAASEFEYGERRVYEIYSKWLTSQANVSLLAQRLLARYRDNPSNLTFRLDAKDRDKISLGSVFDVQFKAFVDYNGLQITQRFQCVSLHEPVPGEQIQVEAIKFDYEIDFLAGRWMANDAPIYSMATEIEKANGMWWADEEGLIDGDDGYVWA